jgi:homoprotocatechuate degradation regulator HpaR
MSRRTGARPGRAEASGLRDFERSLPMQLLHAREAVMERFRPMLLEHGVTEQQWRVLRALEHHGDLDFGGLGDECRLLGPSLTRIVRALEAKRLLTRRADPQDQRRMILSLSDTGRTLLQRVAPHSEARYRILEERVGPERLDLLYAMLDEVIAALDEDDRRDTI